MANKQAETLQIGDFSKITGLAIDTLRYYQKIGLLEPEHYSQSGYRLYGEDNLHRARFIQSAKSLGFSLENIKELLSIQVNKQDASCEDVKHFISGQIEEVDQRINELKRMRKAMERLHNNCCGGKEDARFCSILQALEEGNV